MEITKITKHEVYFVETDEKEYNHHTGYSPDNWTVRMGESDEPTSMDGELEPLFQMGLNRQNGGQWVKCPKCDGQGTVSKPSWIAGDQNTWTDTQTSHTCNLCNGMMVIKQ